MRYLKNQTLSSNRSRLELRSLVPLIALLALACKEPSLDEKLARQTAQYDAALAELADYAARKSEPLPYDWWIEQTDPGEKYRLTPKDVQDLSANLEEEAARVQKSNEAASILDLDRVRADGKVRAFCEALPKGALLHVHPNGTLDRETVGRLLRLTNPKLDRKKLNKDIFAFAIAAGEDVMARIRDPRESFHYNELSEEDQNAFRDLYFLPEDDRDFTHFMFVFRLVEILRDTAGVDVASEIYEAFFKRCQRLGLKYAEIRIGYRAEDSEKLEQINRMTELAAKYDLTVQWIYSFSRSDFPENNLERFKQFLDNAPPPIVCGIDLLGPEEEYPAFEAGHLLFAYIESTIRKGETNLRRTFHAAGLGRPENIRDALAFGVERIGHAARAEQDPFGMYYASQLGVGLEVNLDSNYKLRYHDDYAKHPFLKLLRLGVRASLSTDDEGILQTDIVREFETAITNTDINYAEVKQLTYNSIETSFADKATKAKLLDSLNSDFTRFEQEWSEYAKASQ